MAFFPVLPALLISVFEVVVDLAVVVLVLRVELALQVAVLVLPVELVPLVVVLLLQVELVLRVELVLNFAVLVLQVELALQVVVLWVDLVRQVVIAHLKGVELVPRFVVGAHHRDRGVVSLISKIGPRFLTWNDPLVILKEWSTYSILVKDVE